MGIGEARTFINRTIRLCWLDRKGGELSESVQVFDVGFVPLYGPCLFTSQGEIRLDRIQGFSEIPSKVAA